MTEMQHVRGACPLDCPDTCSWIVTVQDGRAIKLQGDRAHPFTRGALCNKLNDYIAYTQSSERLLYPMRRVGPKGGGSFERISWDEALAEISARLLKISEEFGAEAIWPYLGSGNMALASEYNATAAAWQCARSLAYQASPVTGAILGVKRTWFHTPELPGPLPAVRPWIPHSIRQARVYFGTHG